MKYVIEHDGVLWGPFNCDRTAAEWALKNCSTPWRLRTINILPPDVTESTQ